MAHITRCPHCHTAFKVTPEQLHAAHGRVRCGHCGEIFNGADHLLSTFEPAPAQSPAPSAPVVPLSPAPSSSANWPVLFGEPMESLYEAATNTGEPGSDEDEDDAADGDLEEEACEPIVPDSTPAVTATHSAASGSLDCDPVLNSVDAPEKSPQDPGDPPRPEPTLKTWDDLRADPPAEATSQARAGDDWHADFSAASGTSGLTLHADDRAYNEPFTSGHGQYVETPRGESHAARVGWWLLALLLVLALIAQGALWQRSWIAARWPIATPALQALCAPLHCTVSPYQQLSAISISDSQFRATTPGGNTFELALALRNRADLIVAVPHLELTLTDGERRILVRRVLGPADLDAPTVLAPGASTHIRRTLSVAPLPGSIANYTVTAFYP